MKKKPLHTTVVKVFATSKGSTRPPDVQIGEIRLDYYKDGEVATLVSGAPGTMGRVLDAAREATGTRKVVRKPSRRRTFVATSSVMAHATPKTFPDILPPSFICTYNIHIFSYMDFVTISPACDESTHPESLVATYRVGP